MESAGTAVGQVTWEAARTLEYLGIETHVYEDCGVAGLWRLLANLDEINKADSIIAVAGLDAALSSMLASCAPGIGVMNIGNGYGAACAAARILNHFA